LKTKKEEEENKEKISALYIYRLNQYQQRVETET